jgi:serine/threonine protein kinase
MADEESSLPDEGEFVDPWLGQDLAGYKIMERIGEGGMGIVYLGRHESLGRLAAIKFLGAHMVSDKAYIDRFLHEARGAAKLNHPNIVQVYDAGTMGGDVYYFIMEYVSGKDLGMLLRDMHIFSVGEAVTYIRQAAAALGYAHNKQIIHRDVKPDNLMLTGDNIIKVGDLGLAKWTGDEAHGGVTQTGVVMGTPFYISPEQVKGARDVTARTDVYSLGATLFHLVTSKIPYDGSSPAVIMAMHLNNPVPEPSKINPALDRDICNIIKKMMAKKPDDRYQTMDEVDQVLAEYLSRGSHPTQILAKLPARGAVQGQQSTTITPLRGWGPTTIAESEAGSHSKVGVAAGLSILLGGILLALIVTAISHPRPSQDVAPSVPAEVSPAPTAEPIPESPPPPPPVEAPVETPPAPPA